MENKENNKGEERKIQENGNENSRRWMTVRSKCNCNWKH